MSKQVYLIFGSALVMAFLIVGLQYLMRQRSVEQPTPRAQSAPVAEDPIIEDAAGAQKAAVRFVQDFIASASDPNAAQRAYAALTPQAQENVSLERLQADLMAMLRVSSIPKDNVRVDQLIPTGDNQLWVIVDLTYDDSQEALRALHMVREGSEWKVASVGEVRN